MIISNLSVAFGLQLQPDSCPAVAEENYLINIGLRVDEIGMFREPLNYI